LLLIISYSEGMGRLGASGSHLESSILRMPRSGGPGDQKPSQADSSVRPYLEKSLHKKGLMEWLKV
jgi:hypothetical protein